MTWKRSRDGGLDYDVRRQLEYNRVIREMEERHEKANDKMKMWMNKRNLADSAHTVTFNTNVEHVEF
jgi:hypothetical protein